MRGWLTTHPGLGPACKARRWVTIRINSVIKELLLKIIKDLLQARCLQHWEKLWAEVPARTFQRSRWEQIVPWAAWALTTKDNSSSSDQTCTNNSWTSTSLSSSTHRRRHSSAALSLCQCTPTRAVLTVCKTRTNSCSKTRTPTSMK